MILNNVPNSLKNIPNPPKKLYYRGDLDLLNNFKIAIVGSRKPSSYTKNMVYNLSNEIAKRGGVIVSGGAMGVDAIAHNGAGDRTIAVMGNSLDIIYPKVNKELINNIYKKSLGLSEYIETTKARPYHFVQRNRLVTGLSHIVIIAQADKKSGSMRSAEFAIKQGKALYVFPHHIGESEGTNELLAKGLADPILNINNFLNDIGLEQQNSEEDPLLEFCKNTPSLEVAFNMFKDKIYEYELDGKIEIINGNVRCL